MSRRLKVLISAYACEPNKGSEPEVGWQWSLQMARFHDVTVLTRANNRPAIENAMSRLGAANPRFLYFDLDNSMLWLKKRLGANTLYYIIWHRLARRFLADLLRRERFDLLHHVTFAAFRFPTAVWGHGIPCIWGPIGGAESISASLLPWRYPRPLLSEVVRNLDNFQQTATMGLLKQRARQSSLVVSSTRQMQRTFRDLGVATELMPAIGLHTAEFEVPERKVHPQPLRLLYVGNLLALKGLDLALKALKTSGTNASLTLVGSGPFRRDLEQLVLRLGLAGRVVFCGRLPRDQVLGMYRNFDLFVFPSLHDTGGYAVIEAMCNAMPTICLDTGGPGVAVGAGCGICVPLGRPSNVVAALGEAIRLYDQDRERIPRDGMAARSAVEAKYDWQRKGQLMDGYYQTISNPGSTESK